MCVLFLASNCTFGRNRSKAQVVNPFSLAVLENTPKLASPHLLMRLLVDYAAVLSVLHHREPEGARVLCDTWSLQKISHQESDF